MRQLFKIIAVTLSVLLLGGCSSVKNVSNEADTGKTVVQEALKMDRTLLDKGRVFNWESFNAGGMHHNSGTFTIVRKAGDYFELEQTYEGGQEPLQFIGAMINEEIGTDTVNFVFINSQYKEVWKCTYIDEKTIKGTVLDNTFKLDIK